VPIEMRGRRATTNGVYREARHHPQAVGSARAFSPRGNTPAHNEDSSELAAQPGGNPDELDRHSAPRLQTR